MFQFEPGIIIWTAIAFGITVFLLYRSVLPLFISFIEKRERSIAEAIESAEKRHAQSEVMLSQQKKSIEEARRQAESLIKRAQLEAESIKQGIVEKAKDQASLIIRQAESDLVSEKEKLVQQVKRETAEFVAAAASRVLNRVVSLEDHHRLIEESMAEAKNEGN